MPHSMRTLWLLTETIHAVVYFAPEKVEMYRAAGLKGGWMAYFASRAAAMGAVNADVVSATFYNFHPAMVARAIPDAWALSTPTRVTQARLDVAQRALGRVVPADLSDVAADVASVMRTAQEEVSLAGRPLAAAHAAVPPSDEPLLALWQACTVWREYRGDAHVAALVSRGLGPIEAHVTLAASGAATEETLRVNRGWSEEEWSAARQGLVDAGLLDPRGLTAAGTQLRADVERVTDERSAPPWLSLSDDELERVTRALRAVARAVTSSGIIPFPNPMGLHEAELTHALEPADPAA